MLNLFVKTKCALAQFKRDEDGATAIEYGLFAALIGAAIVTIVGLLGTEVKTGFQTVCDALKGSAC